jgi:hypothetical protein
MLDKAESIRVATEPLGDQTDWSVPNNLPWGSTSAPRHSFGLAMAKHIARATGIKPMLLPCAIGSTSIEEWLDFDDELDRTTLFGAMNYRIQSVIDGVLTDPVFCWFGHEGSSELPVDDLTNGTISNGYTLVWDELMHQIRMRYPSSPILYAQLTCHSDATSSANHRRAGEAQRQAEADFGDGSTIFGYRSAGIDIETSEFNPRNTDGSNVVTLTESTARWVSDGSEACGFDVVKLIPDTIYRLTVTVTGKCSMTNVTVTVTVIIFFITLEQTSVPSLMPIPPNLTYAHGHGHGHG